MKEQPVKTVAAVERAFSILDSFKRGDVFLSLSELSRRTGLYKSTILRLIQTLESAGYIAKNGVGEYHIGPSVLRLGGLYQAAMKPEEVIMPALRRMVSDTNESAGFHIRFGDKRLCLHRVDSPHPLRDHFRPGDALPLNRGAGGKVLSAFAKPYLREFAALRRKLVISASGEIAPDMGGVACPVFGSAGELFGALTLSGPTSRFNRKSIPQFEDIVLAAARQVTEAMGGDTAPFDDAFQRRGKGKLRKLAVRKGR